MIRIEGLTRSYGKLEAVRGINLDIPQGEFFAFLGPNAAGKTTTIKMLAGLLKPTAGRAIVGGFDVQTDPAEAKKVVAYVPDFPFLYDKLTPVEFMRFVGELFLMNRESIQEKTEALFELMHLNEHRDQLIENLSHGTRQRVVISSALLHDPKVIIIDEPMVGLDPRHAAIVKQELKRRSAAGTTIFLSTHQLSVAEEVADRVAIINHGQVIALGTVDELKGLSTDKGALEKVFLELVGD
ncbi:MAG TPA: ABC transporter ATP-binding protein [Chthoniobacterales bacterium]|jgi:ABC-2 type transport system ATP-binding protein